MGVDQSQAFSSMKWERQHYNIELCLLEECTIKFGLPPICNFSEFKAKPPKKCRKETIYPKMLVANYKFNSKLNFLLVLNFKLGIMFWLYLH